MEIRAFAERVLLQAALDEKLVPPDHPLTDASPGAAVRVEVPVRTADLIFAPRRTAPHMPAPAALKDPSKRGLVHHILANHELQALEVMAWTLLAFPDAPPEFRQGLVDVMRDEQRHTRMHLERAERHGVRFGSFPVNCYIWKKAMQFTSVLDYVAGLPLVFEGANLDHSLEWETAFLAAGDLKSAAVMRRIHEDEIEHVRFGICWLRKLKPAVLSDWEAFEQHLHWPLRPSKSRGNAFQREARLRAGLTEDFIDHILKPESHQK